MVYPIESLADLNPAASILVSGASGMLGEALRQALTSRGTPVLQLVREAPVRREQLHWNPAASQVVADLQSLEDLKAAIHLSGASLAAHRWTRAYKHEITRTRVQSTRNLVATLVSLKNPPHTLLVASAIGFYGDRGDDLLDERSKRGNGFLAELCQEWEEASEPAAKAGIRVVHLRFGVVLASSGGALGKLLPLFRLGLGGRLGSGRQWMSWISLADLVSGTLFALDNSTLAGPLNLTAPSPVTNADFTRALAHALHRPAFVPVPAPALRLAIGEMADAALLSSARVFPAKLVTAGFQFTHSTIEQAMAAAIRK